MKYVGTLMIDKSLCNLMYEIFMVVYCKSACNKSIIKTYNI